VYGEKNSFRLRAYHRLDLGATFTKAVKHGERVLLVDAYYAYSRHNRPWLKVWSRSRIRPMGMDEKWLKGHENGPFWMPIVAPPVVRH